MAALYDFSAHRAARLLDRISQQTGQVRVKLLVVDASISSASKTLKRASLKLSQLGTSLESLQLSCLQSLKQNEECKKVLEIADLEMMVKYRNRLVETSSRQI